MQNSWLKIGMARGKVSCVFLAVMLFGSLLHAQTTWYVATNGVDNTDVGRGMSWDLPFATVSNAYRSASSTLSDMILVSNGTYLLSQHVLVNKPVTISGFNTPGQTNTIIDGQDAARGFLVRHPQSVVEGFMITNCNPGAGIDGGGVFMTNGILRNCIVAFNTGRRGGGVYQQLAGVISNCVIYGNTAGEPGGLYGGGGVLLVSDGEIHDSVITNNNAVGASGGGIDVGVNSLIVNCHVINNETTSTGGGIRIRDAFSVVSNTVIVSNECGSSGGGVFIQGAANIYGGLIAHNIAAAGGGICFMNTAIGEVCDVSIYTNQAQHGGGVYVYGQALITNCNIIGNQTIGGQGGGGIVFNTTGSDGIGTVTHSRVKGNIVNGIGNDSHGGGIRISRVIGPVVIKNTEITDNTISNANRARGGGIYISSNTVVRNSLITGNWISGSHSDGGQGGGVYINETADPANLIESCTISGNYGRVAGGGVYLDMNGSDILRNSIVDGNTVDAGDNNWYFGDNARKANVSYTCTPDADVDWGAGNITGDPLFADPGTGNYRLRAGSPGINTGLNQTDWMPGAMDLDGRPRIDRFSGVVDMGCYEYISSGAMFYVH